MPSIWTRAFLLIGGLLMATAVAAGAFAAHGLSRLVAPELLAWFEIGVRYQLIHGLAVVVCGVVTSFTTIRRVAIVSGLLFILGCLLFCASLYLRVLTDNASWGALAPFGGASFIAGWLVLGLGAWFAKPKVL